MKADVGREVRSLRSVDEGTRIGESRGGRAGGLG